MSVLWDIFDHRTGLPARLCVKLYGAFLAFGQSGRYNERREVVGMDQNKTGRLIRALRQAQGLTQRALAGRIGVSDKAVSKWERGVSLS